MKKYYTYTEAHELAKGYRSFGLKIRVTKVGKNQYKVKEL